LSYETRLRPALFRAPFCRLLALRRQSWHVLQTRGTLEAAAISALELRRPERLCFHDHTVGMRLSFQAGFVIWPHSLSPAHLGPTIAIEVVSIFVCPVCFRTLKIHIWGSVLPQEPEGLCSPSAGGAPAPQRVRADGRKLLDVVEDPGDVAFHFHSAAPHHGLRNTGKRGEKSELGKPRLSLSWQRLDFVCLAKDYSWNSRKKEKCFFLSFLNCSLLKKKKRNHWVASSCQRQQCLQPEQ